MALDSENKRRSALGTIWSSTFPRADVVIDGKDRRQMVAVYPGEGVSGVLATEISNYAELQAIGVNLSLDYIQVADIDGLSESVFVPLGEVGDAFLGSYDGQGFTLSNIDIDGGNLILDVALFGRIGDSVVLDDITIIDSTAQKSTSRAAMVWGSGGGSSGVEAIITNCLVKDCVISDADLVGGFASIGSFIDVSNCIVDGCLIGTSGNPSTRTGGFIATGSSNVTYTQCSADTTIEADASLEPVGGFCGKAQLGVTFDECETRGTIVITNSAIAGVGGFIGLSVLSVSTDCESRVDLGSIFNAGQAGFVGVNTDGDYSRCVSNTSASFTPTEMITNGDMELDSNWADLSTPTTNERSNEQANGGSFSRKFVVSSETDGIISDNFTVVVDTDYTIDFWVYPVDVPTLKVLTYTGAGGLHTIYHEAGLSLGQWNHVIIAHRDVVGGIGGAVAFVSETGQTTGTWYIDDVSVKLNTGFHSTKTAGTFTNNFYNTDLYTILGDQGNVIAATSAELVDGVILIAAGYDVPATWLLLALATLSWNTLAGIAVGGLRRGRGLVRNLLKRHRRIRRRL